MRMFASSSPAAVQPTSCAIAPAPAPLECGRCHKSFHTASPDAIVRDGGCCTGCGGPLLHTGVGELLAV